MKKTINKEKINKKFKDKKVNYEDIKKFVSPLFRVKRKKKIKTGKEIAYLKYFFATSGSISYILEYENWEIHISFLGDKVLGHFTLDYINVKVIKGGEKEKSILFESFINAKPEEGKIYIEIIPVKETGEILLSIYKKKETKKGQHTEVKSVYDLELTLVNKEVYVEEYVFI